MLQSTSPALCTHQLQHLTPLLTCPCLLQYLPTSLTLAVTCWHRFFSSWPLSFHPRPRLRAPSESERISARLLLLPLAVFRCRPAMPRVFSVREAGRGRAMDTQVQQGRAPKRAMREVCGERISTAKAVDKIVAGLGGAGYPGAPQLVRRGRASWKVCWQGFGFLRTQCMAGARCHGRGSAAVQRGRGRRACARRRLYSLRGRGG